MSNIERLPTVGIDALPIAVNEEELQKKGFTGSGIRQFRDTLTDYGRELMERATHFGEADKAVGMQLEVAHDHVRSAAHSMAKSFGNKLYSPWLIASQVGEYLFTATAGVGGGHLDKPAGIVCFGVGISIAVILVVVRLTRTKAD